MATSSTKEMVKEVASEIKVGDRVSSTKGGTPQEVTEIRDGATSRRLVMKGGGNLRPRKTTQLWVERDSSATPEPLPAKRGRGRKAATPAAPATVTAERVAKALKRAKLPEGTKLDTEQAQRACDALMRHAGLTGTALAKFILDGTTLGEQTAAATAERKRAARANGSTPPAAARGPREGSTLSAIITVLGNARQPLTAAEVFERIRKGNLAPELKGKTPEQTIAARLSANAKRGQYFERKAPGKYALIREGK